MTTSNPSTGLYAGQAVIVTGAGSGIGRATAVAFAGAGARVLGVGRRAEALAETAALHPAITAFPADVNRDGGPEEVVAAAAEGWGRLDVAAGRTFRSW